MKVSYSYIQNLVSYEHYSQNISPETFLTLFVASLSSLHFGNFGFGDDNNPIYILQS